MFDLHGDPCTTEASGLADVDRRLMAIAGQTGSDAVAQALRGHVGAGGRRVRARMALAAASALGLDGRPMATATEALHQASLIHDDLSDGSPERRGQPAIWCAYGHDHAVACGDLMIAGAFAALAESGSAAGLMAAEASRAVARTIRGQAADLARSAPPSLRGWLATARRKSGPLLGLGPSLALVTAGLPHLVPHARRGADWLAVAYQVADDLADEAEDRAAGAPNVMPAMRAIHGDAAARWAAIGLGLEALVRSEARLRGLPPGVDAAYAIAAQPTRARLIGAADAV